VPVTYALNTYAGLLGRDLWSEALSLMSEKGETRVSKKPIGIIIFSGVGILLGIFFFVAGNPIAHISNLIAGLVFGGAFIVLHVGLLMMANWARKAIIVCSYLAASIGFPCLLIFTLGIGVDLGGVPFISCK